MNAVIKRIKDYLSLVRFSHTIFAMPFSILGYFTAVTSDNGAFSIKILLLVILCMILARNAAMAFNRYADYKIDKLNPRTMHREIPSGKISPFAALIFIIINSILFIIATAFINKLTLWLSPVALIVVLGYSLMKRITSLSHLVLGLALSLAPVGAYISVTGRFDILPVIYSLVVLSWVSGFDIIYSVQDIGFDEKQKLFSIPSKFGLSISLMISLALHIISISLVIIAGIILKPGLLYWAGCIIFGILLIWEHILVRPGHTEKINMAFATLNSYAGLLFCTLAVLDLYI